MIVTDAALAQAPASGLFSSGMAGFFFEIVVIIGIFYFLMIRPQQKQRQKHEESLRALRKGDEVVTTGGIVGKVIFIKETTKDGEPVRAMDDRVTIESGESRLIVERGKIVRVGSTQTSAPNP
jgi:preprotein translocase subunit YajC